jgi:hypothetical protein
MLLSSADLDGGGNVMVRDGVANIVGRLRECGFEPRKVGHDAWESRCPAHRSLDHTLSITRNEFNHVVLTCRSVQNCTHLKIIRAVGFTNDQLYAETPDWLIGRLRRIAVEPEERADIIEEHREIGETSNEAATPIIHESSHAASLSPEADITWEPAEIASSANEAASPLCHETAHATPLAPEIVAETNGSASPSDNETSHVVAVAAASSAVDTVKESPTDALMRMAGVERVIRGSDGRSYALVSANGKAECRELKSKGLRNLLAHAAFKASGKLPTPEAIAAVVGVLEASAEFDGTHEDVFLRVACGPSGSSYFLDLADREGRMIEIRPDGWELVAAPPVFFRRAIGQLPLPVPERGGSLELLKKYVNADDSDWPLFIGWLTGSLRPVGPHPILVVTGEQGAAKTTLLRICRRLIDPNASPVRAQPIELRDLMIAARKSWLLAYDNITKLPVWLSNGLCGLATGTGFTIRSLGTDDDEAIFVAQRPIIINGISDFVEKADLGDRSFYLHLPRISDLTRRTEQAFWADFDRDCPLILGALLDAVSAGMRALPEVQPSRLSRLADAERWGEAVARGLGWAPAAFTSSLGENRAEANEWTLEESPVAVALIDLSIRCASFRGTMQELLPALASLAPASAVRSCHWPKSPRALSVKVRQVAPQLRSIGIDVELRRETRGRFVTVAMSGEKGRFATARENTLIDARFRAYIEQENRSVG